jgi:hypothetical protein
MKILLKVTAVILLLVITLLSINAVEGASPSKIVIDGVGQPTVKADSNGNIEWKCDATTSNKCTITIVFNQ